MQLHFGLSLPQSLMQSKRSLRLCLEGTWRTEVLQGAHLNAPLGKGTLGAARVRTNFLQEVGVGGEGRWSFPGRGGVGRVLCVGGTVLSANSLLCFSAGGTDVAFGFPQFPVSV